MGLPAKSGVSGIIIVVVPNVVGFATYSPNLDTVGKGNAAHICTVAISLVHQKTVMEKINWLKQSFFLSFLYLRSMNWRPRFSTPGILQ